MSTVDKSMQHSAITGRSDRAPNRSQQQDAKAWAAYTGCTYTAALRQMMSPMAQGILGSRISARHLIATLKNHELIGIENKHSVAPLYDPEGVRTTRFGTTWPFNGKTDYVELAMIVDFLRMFDTIEFNHPDEGARSYSLKHTAEYYLDPHLRYVSNGQAIWAAAALGIPLIDDEDHEGSNVYIGINYHEHRYVRNRGRRDNEEVPHAHHYRPAGFDYLREGLDRAAAGELITEKWIEPEVDTTPKPFHEWMVKNRGRDTITGFLATHYCAGIEDSDHDMAVHPGDFIDIMNHSGADWNFRRAGYGVVRDYYRAFPDTPPIRPHHLELRSDLGYEFPSSCPCGQGYVEKDEAGLMVNNCERCSMDWHFTPSNHPDSWGLMPVTWIM